MKIGVLSDTHIPGACASLPAEIVAAFKDVDLILHAGDLVEMKVLKELRKIAVLLENGLEQWFTCLKYDNVQLTNNRAERELREFVVQRKIYSTFRSEQGLRTTEIILSALATWKLRGLNMFTMLRQVISS